MLALGDIEDHAVEEERLAVVAEYGLALVLKPADGAVAVDDPVIDDIGLPRCDRSGGRLVDQGAIVGVNDGHAGHRAGHQFLGGVAADAFDLLAEEQLAAVGAAGGAVDRAWNVRGDRLVFDLAVAQFLAGGSERIIRLPLRGHVGAGAAIAEEVAVGIEEGLAAAAEVVERAVRHPFPELEIAERPAQLDVVSMLRPGVGVPGQVRCLPAGLAQTAVEVDAVAGPGAGGEEGEAVVGAGFPQPV